MLGIFGLVNGWIVEVIECCLVHHSIGVSMPLSFGVEIAMISLDLSGDLFILPSRR